MTIMGLMVGVAAVWFVLASGGIMGMLFNINAAILVFGGVFGATLITYPWRLIKRIPKGVWLMFFPLRIDLPSDIIKVFETCSKRIHKEGISTGLLEVIPSRNKFFVKAINFLVDGFEDDFIRETMENEIDNFKKRHNQAADVFKSMGAYAPIFGLLGTLIGVVQVLQNLTDPASMGASMAIAITTTFYGIFSTNFLFLPIAGKLSVHTNRETLIKELVIEGTSGLKKGEIPSILRHRLQSFLADYEKK